MKVSFITYADLGDFKNLKTADIADAISYFNNKKLLDTVICRIGSNIKYKNYSALPFLFHILVAGVGKIISKFPTRKIEEYIFDFYANKVFISKSIVFFHPPKFPKSIQKTKRQKCINVGIVVNSDPNHTSFLLKEEIERQNISNYNIDISIEADYSKEMDYLIALSKFSKETYVNYGYPENKIYIANLDVDTVRFSPKYFSKKEFIVVFPASNIGILKGLQYLLDAWTDLNIPNKKLIILGARIGWPDELEKKYSKIIKDDSSIEEKQIVKNPEYYFNLASVVVLPSFTEGFSRSVAEAMSCGIPVITTKNATDIGNFFIDKENGLLVPVADSRAILNALIYLYENKEERVRIGKNARDIVINKKSFSQSLYEIYKDIIKRENII